MDSEADSPVAVWARHSHPDYKMLLHELAFCCYQEGEAFDELFSFLLRVNADLKQVNVSGVLSAACAMALFDADRCHRTLTVDTVTVPHIPESRHTLQQQTQLTSVAVKTGTDFLYYLPFLPPSVRVISLQIRVGARRNAGYISSLDEVEGLVKSCFADKDWCPGLARVQFLVAVHVENVQDQDILFQRCDKMEAELRAIALGWGQEDLATGIFWKPVEFLESEGSDDEDLDEENSGGEAQVVDNSDDEVSDGEGEVPE